MKRILLLLLIATIIGSCAKKAQRTESTTNDNFNLELLFEKDGCRIYRFKDAGEWVYWTDCRGAVRSSYHRQVGKTRVTDFVQNETSE